MTSIVLRPNARRTTRCWLADHGVMERGSMPPCDGGLIHAHLLPRQLLTKELEPKAAAYAIHDRRSWVWACGGPMGNAGHHGMLDAKGCNALRIPRGAIPLGTELLAHELGLTWWLDREYGRRGPTNKAA